MIAVQAVGAAAPEATLESIAGKAVLLAKNSKSAV